MVATAGDGLTVPAMVPSSALVSAQMSRHPRKDTEPELALRRLLFARGLRYRVHLRVPGLSRRTIDIAFPGPKLAVFVDGCFWHGCPAHGTVPRSNEEWWRRKIEGTRRRDDETASHLAALGWEVLRFWCHEEAAAAADAVAAGVRNRTRATADVDGHDRAGTASGQRISGSAAISSPSR
jgi:DNA mismatch endonuclease (patch repair protein)